MDKRKFNMDGKTAQVMKVLEQLLKENFDSGDYTIGAVLDSSVCLEQIGGRWHVLEGARYARHNEQEYDELTDAAEDVFGRLGTEAEAARLIGEFRAELKQLEGTSGEIG